MALQTSGAISLDQIHVEANGTTGTQASLNDSDIRNLNEASGRVINNTLGTEIDFADFYGATNDPRVTFPISGSASTGNRTINVDYVIISGGGFNFHYMGFDASHGSLSNASWGGATITELTQTPSLFGGTTSYIALRIGTPVFNSGWSSLVIYHSNSSGGPSSPVTLNRNTATYTYNATSTVWSWDMQVVTGLGYTANQILGHPRNVAFTGTQAQTFSIT